MSQFKCVGSLTGVLRLKGTLQSPRSPLPKQGQVQLVTQDCAESRTKQLHSLPGQHIPVFIQPLQGSDECIGISGVPSCHWAPLEEPGSVLFSPSFHFQVIFMLSLCLHSTRSHSIVQCIGKKKYNCYFSRKQGKHSIVQRCSSLRTLDCGECWISKENIFYRHKAEE